MATNTKELTTLASRVAPLTSASWFKWKFEMDMIFGMGNLDDVIYGKEKKPTTAGDDQTQWVKKDKFARGLIYFQISMDYQPMFQTQTTSYELWSALEKKFQASTMSSRIEARRTFYTTTQEASQSVDFYIQALKTARIRLQAMGQTISDQEYKDILLMNLHSDFHSIRTSLMSQTPEPSVEQVESVLSSSPLETTHTIKSESVFSVRPRFHGGAGRDRSTQEYPVDERGNRWCDAGRSNVCHRCGRAGHQAPLCIGDMPKNVKDWVLGRHHSAHIADGDMEAAHFAHFSSSSSSSDGPMLI